MADPSARFILTAEDRTGRAFASADRSIRTISRNVLQFRSLLAGFGVIASGRMFANWVKDAIQVNKLTAEQAEALGGAKKAVGELNSAFQDLARTAAAELAPKLEHAAKFWKAFLFPTSQFGSAADQVREQVDAQVAEVERLQSKLTRQQNRQVAGRSEREERRAAITETTGLLATATAELDRLRTSWQGAMGGATTNFVAGFKRIGDFADRNKGALRPTTVIDFLDEDALDFIKAGNGESLELPVSLQLQTVPQSEIDALFAPIKSEGIKAAEFIGDSFLDSFRGWLIDGEFDFKDFLRRMAIHLGTSALFSYAASLFPGGSFLGKLFGGSRASGGPVSGGMMYRVHPGEAFFTPGQDGHVGKSGGGIQIGAINVDARGTTDPAAVEAAVERAVITAVSITEDRTNAKLRALGRPAIA